MNGGAMSGHPRCRWCRERHEPRWLCDAAQRILDMLYAKGIEGDMPTLEFPDAPVKVPGLDEDMVLIAQTSVMAATVPAAGIPMPALMLTGRDAAGQPLPRWFYAASDEQITAFVELVGRMGALAIRTAEQQRADVRRRGQGR